MGISILVTSGKGGTGKTSFTCGVGACLAGLGKKVLCLDSDVGLRNLDIVLGMSDSVLMDFTDVIAGRSTLMQAAKEHPRVPGLFLLTAPQSEPDRSVSPFDMLQLMEDIRARFDYCLIDSPAGIGSGFRLAASCADRMILVCHGEQSSLRDGQHAAALLRGYHAPIHLVMNRVKGRTLRKLGLTIDDAMDLTGLPLLGIVPEDPEVSLAANRGEPLVLTNDRKANVAYCNIARRICGARVPLMKVR